MCLCSPKLVSITFGTTEYAGHENVAQSEMQVWKMRYMKMRHRGGKCETWTLDRDNAVFHWAVRSAQERYLPEFSATFDIRHCNRVLKPIVRTLQCWCGLSEDILNKSRLNWKLKISNTAVGR